MTGRLTLLVAMLALAGCGQETLYSNLGGREANEMLSILLSHDVGARKVGLGDSLEIRIARNDLPTAIALLAERGYPKEKFQSLGDVFEREGFVSSPVEERARLLYALSQELSRTVSTIDGVVAARVHLAIPERRPLADSIAPSSASIFIKHRPGAAVTEQAASVKALVVNSIEGLPYENVTVTFFPAASASRYAARTPAEKLASVSLESWSAAGVVTLLLAALSHSAWRRRGVVKREKSGR